MKNFKNILIKVNEQTTPEVDTAVLRGIKLAKRSGAKVILFNPSEQNFDSNYSKQSIRQ